MRSSYRKNNYGLFFESMVAVYQPKIIVECGVLDGYSLIALAKQSPSDAKVIGYDLFEEYEFIHGTKELVQFAAWKYGVPEYKVDLVKMDAIEAANEHKDGEVDLLHIDISNTGENLPKVFDAWQDKVSENGIIIFEGGSVERDNIEWMTEYKKTPIRDFLPQLKDRGFNHIVHSPFPSLTVCTRV